MGQGCDSSHYISCILNEGGGGGVGGGLVGHDSSLLEALYAVCSMQSTGVLLDTFDVFCHEFAQRSVLYG